MKQNVQNKPFVNLFKVVVVIITKSNIYYQLIDKQPLITHTYIRYVNVEQVNFLQEMINFPLKCMLLLYNIHGDTQMHAMLYLMYLPCSILSFHG